MKYAKLIKLGGELIPSSEADYEDYKGLLVCPVCNEVVFLRKAHSRGSTQVESSFCHHRFTFASRECEIRVASYKQDDLIQAANAARGQRLQLLEISMWKFLKTNKSLDFSQWSAKKKSIENIRAFQKIFEFAQMTLDFTTDLLIDIGFDKVDGIFKHPELASDLSRQNRESLDYIMNDVTTNWNLHSKIAKEALTLFLKSYSMLVVRQRVIWELIHPSNLVDTVGLVDLHPNSRDWKIKFSNHLVVGIIFIFLSVNWLEVFGEKLGDVPTSNRTVTSM
jgi:hypothetical protein